MQYKIIYFGTSEVAVLPLEYLNTEQEIIAVVTQPDSKIGRKQILTPSPVKVKAQELGLSILQPESIKMAEFIELLKNLEPDFLVVLSYGKIIPPEILEIPKYMPINIHPSILPQYRGATPMQQALLNGDSETGVTFIKMDAGIDTGDILFTKRMQIDAKDKFPELSHKLSNMGGLILSTLLDDIAEGVLSPIPQDNSRASLCQKIKKSDAAVDWERESAEQIVNKLRAYTPWPGCYSFLDGKRVKFLELAAAEEDHKLKAAEGLAEDGKLFIGTKEGSLEVLELQIEGKKAMKVEDFLKGYKGEFEFETN